MKYIHRFEVPIDGDEHQIHAMDLDDIIQLQARDVKPGDYIATDLTPIALVHEVTPCRCQVSGRPQTRVLYWTIVDDDAEGIPDGGGGRITFDADEVVRVHGCTRWPVATWPPTMDKDQSDG